LTSRHRFHFEKELYQMPWTPNDAERHTHKATTWTLKELWAKVANEALERTGDEGRAIREANAVIARQANARYLAFGRGMSHGFRASTGSHVKYRFNRGG
jgi:hypothetical protein